MIAMRRDRRAMLWGAMLALLLPALPAGLAAQPRHETVAGWRLSSGGTGDGGREVRMSRRGPGYSVSYFYEFWRGNGGVVVGASFRRGGCRSGESGTIMPFESGLSRATLHDKLTDYLRECPLPRREAAALRRSADAAWPRFAALARRARAATDAENRAIENYGR